MEQRQGVVAFAGEADEVLGVLALESAALVVVREDEDPALAVDIGRSVGLREVAAEALGLDGVIVPRELAPGVLDGVGVSWCRAQQGSGGDQQCGFHCFSLATAQELRAAPPKRLNCLAATESGAQSPSVNGALAPAASLRPPTLHKRAPRGG